ncbi:MAG: PqqD family peptide modification chaperone [Halobacteriales archaeon]|nr:PqqD family peptide modification chaperone [Halobacteriales archaeon]
MERIPDASRAIPRRGDVEAREEEGRVVLVRRRFGPARRGFLRLLKVEPDMTVRLDALGTAVWNLINGSRTVAQIHAELERTFPGEADLAPRLGTFLGAMVSRELVRLG